MDAKGVKMYYSQSGQDKWVCEYYKYKKNGYFVEVGAYDEADKNIFKNLETNRKSKNLNIAINSKKGTCNLLGDKINNDGVGQLIECDTLNEILLNNYCNKNIDYLSLDIEGMEYEALLSLDFNYWNIKLMTVEHNLYCSNSMQKDKIYKLLSEKGFDRVVEDAKCLDKNPLYYNKPYEDWYAKK
jgi:hypothetical protein